MQQARVSRAENIARSLSKKVPRKGRKSVYIEEREEEKTA